MHSEPPIEEPPIEEPLIEVEAVSRVYKRPFMPAVVALDAVSLTVNRGERFGIVGESGSGKSTLVRLMAGLDRPTSGRIRRTGHLQLVFQDPMSSLDPRMRVGDIIAEPLRGKDRFARVAELLTAVGLPESAAGRFPHQFSGGQRQRIAIARALAPHPQVLVADEPVSALDVSVRAQILNLLADLVERYDLTLVFVSHDLSVVRRVCDRVAVLSRGHLVELGPTEQVYEAPQHPYTRQLVSAIPTLKRALS
jgi:peptide/nickel transport system ATP-binding protein